MSDPEFRIEHDSMGDVRVPATAKWRAQTQRAVENFPVSGLSIDAALISALAQIKGASVRVRAELGMIDPTLAQGHEILDRFGDRLRHLHVSALDAAHHHVALSAEQEERIRPLLERCRDVPWILEAPLA